MRGSTSAVVNIANQMALRFMENVQPHSAHSVDMLRQWVLLETQHQLRLPTGPMLRGTSSQEPSQLRHGRRMCPLGLRDRWRRYQSESSIVS